MTIAYVTIAGLLLTLVLLRQRHPVPGHLDVALQGWRQLQPLITRIPLALIAGSFLAALIPEAVVAAVLGDASGLQGILLATAVGAIMPGGPMITFPLALVLLSAGVGLAQMVTLITAWSVLALHRVLVFEIPTLGWRPTVLRLLACLMLPPLAGLLTMALALRA